MKLWWYSAANILYALGSLGYLTVNITTLIDPNTGESLIIYSIFVFLAIVFVIDALLYTADWIEQRATKKRRELIGCILNIVGSILYLIGAILFKNTAISTNDFTNISDIPTFVFNIVGMLAFVAESILNFFTPRVSNNPSKCSVEYFAHILNLFGNLIYLTAHIVQPIITFIASFTTDFLNNITDFIFIIISPIEISGDIIYTIDAILYMIVWIEANEQRRRIGVTWIELGNATINKIVRKNRPNVITSEQLPETIVGNIQPALEYLPMKAISMRIPEPIMEEVEPSRTSHVM